jgi:hypothetical protein
LKSKENLFDLLKLIMEYFSRSNPLPAYGGAYDMPHVLKTQIPCIIETPTSSGLYGGTASDTRMGLMKSMHKHKFSPKSKRKGKGIHLRHLTMTETASQAQLEKLP